jgi:hypothetical protein
MNGFKIAAMFVIRDILMWDDNQNYCLDNSPDDFFSHVQGNAREPHKLLIRMLI